MAVHADLFDGSVDCSVPFVVSSFVVSVVAEEEVLCFMVVCWVGAFMIYVVIPCLDEPSCHECFFSSCFSIVGEYVLVSVVEFEPSDLGGSSYGVVFKVEYEPVEAGQVFYCVEYFLCLCWFDCEFPCIDRCYGWYGDVFSLRPSDESLYAPESYGVTVLFPVFLAVGDVLVYVVLVDGVVGFIYVVEHYSYVIGVGVACILFCMLPVDILFVFV